MITVLLILEHLDPFLEINFSIDLSITLHGAKERELSHAAVNIDRMILEELIRDGYDFLEDPILGLEVMSVK